MTEVLTAPEEIATHTKTRNSGILAETKDSKVNALHVICERAGGGFDYYRYNRGENTWTGPLPTPGSKGNIHGPVVYTGSDYKLDALYREVTEKRENGTRPTGTLYHTYTSTYHDTTVFNLWTGPRYELPEGKDVNGPPAVCRWNLGAPGAEIIAPVASGGFRHWYRNDAARFYTTGKFYRNPFSGLAMVLGPGKLLYVVAVETDGTLWAIHRDDDQKWQSKILGKAFVGQPALVESNRDANTVYDLVVPNATGQLIHYAVGSWFNQREVARFGVAGRIYSEVGLVYNYANQLEVVARPAAGGQLEHYINGFDNKGWVAGMPFPAANTQGSWNVKYDLEVIGIHSTLLRTNDVVTYGMSDDNEHHAVGSFVNLPSGTITRLDHPMPHVFCSGQAQLPNGDLLVAGGHSNSEHHLHKLTRVDEVVWKWKKLKDLHHGRWYPTVTTLPDGKVLILGGAYKTGGGSLNNSYELFDPNNEDDSRKRIDLWDEIGEKFSDDYDHIDMYPFVFVLPNKRVFVHSRYSTRFFDYPKSGRGSWSSRIDANLKSPRTYGFQGTAVLLPLKADASNDYLSPTVAMFGGAGAKNAGIDTPATDTVELMIADAPTPSWTFTTKMNTPRVMPDAVLLPDGKVLIVSGSRTGLGSGRASRQPVLNAEIFDPESKTFTEVAPMRVQRLYHASAVLLPDARVLVTGKCKVYNTSPYNYPEHRGEVYTPAYLLTDKARPTITEAPATIGSAAVKFDVKVGEVAPANIKSVTLIRLGAATHSFNMDQRAVSLQFTAAADKLTVTAPKTNWVVPPGYYMLFVVSNDGVPSEAKFVRVATF
jgi:hypothetical protein